MKESNLRKPKIDRYKWEKGQTSENEKSDPDKSQFCPKDP